jgi:Tfp pilus assembly PilM family ATPase
MRAAQLGRDGRPLATAHVRRAAPGEPYEPADFERLRGVLYRRGFRGRELFLAAPKSIVQRTTLDLPPRSSGAPLDEIARSELARQTHARPGSFELAWWDSPQPPRAGSSTRAITLSCPHETASGLLDALDGLGLHARAMISPSTAFALAAPPPPPGSTRGVLDLGWTDATLVVLTPETIIFERQLGGCGLADVIARTAGRRRIDPARLALLAEQPGEATPKPVHELLEIYIQHLTEEMRSSIDYLRGCEGSPDPASITLLGGGAAFPGLARAVADATGVSTRAAECDQGPSFAAAVGLAHARHRCVLEEAA